MDESLEMIIVMLFSVTVVMLPMCLYHLIKIRDKQIDIEKRIKSIDKYVVPSKEKKFDEKVKEAVDILLTP